MWDLPRPGLEPVTPALAGGLLTTAPPRKSHTVSFDPSLVMLILISWQDGVEFCHVISKRKFMCPMHSEAKRSQYVMSEFGAEKCLLQGYARRRVVHALQSLDSLKGFSKTVLKAKWGAELQGT